MLKLFCVLLLAVSLLGPAIHPALAAPPPPEALTVHHKAPEVAVNPYYTTQDYQMSDGSMLQRTQIHGPSQPPFPRLVQPMASEQTSALANTLTNFPSFNWEFGCSAVSAAMIAAYYDRGSYFNLWEDSSAAYPLTDTGFGTWTDAANTVYPNNPLVATRLGLNGLTQYGMIDDLWINYLNTAPDPYITAQRTRWITSTAIGEPMHTSKSTKGNLDGGTSIWVRSDGSRLTCDEIAAAIFVDGTLGFPDGTLGRRNFYQSRHYAVSDCYNQVTDNIAAAGFTLANFQAEIDAGHPVFINLDGHSIVGYGYDGSTIYIRDTWDSKPNLYTMTWGGSYQNMVMESVSIVRLAPLSAPIDITLNKTSIDENKAAGALVGQFTSVDSNPYEGFFYTLVSGAGDTNNALFEISQNALITRASFDYEANAVYSIRVQSEDYTGLTAQKAFTITVNNANDAPSNINLSSNAIAEHTPIGTVLGQLSTNDQDNPDSFTYSFVPGTGAADYAAFTIDGALLNSAVIFDYEIKNSYSIRLRSTDVGGLMTEKAFTIAVTNANDPPSDILISNDRVDENLPPGTLVGTLTAADQDTSTGFTFTLDPNQQFFTLDGGKLYTSASLDFESKSEYALNLEARDPTSLSLQKELTLYVNNVNEAPLLTGLSRTAIPVNAMPGTEAAQVMASDPDSLDTLSFSLAEPNPLAAKLFSLQADKLMAAADLRPYLGQSIVLQLRVTDKGGLSDTKGFIIQITEPPILHVHLPFITR